MSAFILGLAGSVHCIGMCGPIALMIPTGKHNNKLAGILFYSFGKLLTYLIIGSLFGLIVNSIRQFNFQSILSIISGILLILFAVLPQLLKKLEQKGYVLFSGLLKFKSKLTRALDKNKLEFSFYIGFLNGFIPCAMVYSAAVAAFAQNSFMESVGFMLFFGLGTIPLMILFYFTAQKVKSKLMKYTNIFQTLALLGVGLFLIWRGYAHYNEVIPALREGAIYKLCLPFQ
ncbi:sulfite exporter TauE/SafE family protein [Putridiphycobacter roseus]|uniref:sulfite exporter TauE/SafE family protein n=1 Tax=Putridiphycobacter roseus TaxID=2219161 RepID=UPI0011B7CB89|nr:sulfite exporter TauE/SafE family protein [Putridiphycobacter roseus]